MLTSCLLLSLAIAPGLISTLDLITPIANSPGLYFDAIGSLKFYNNYRNIITFSDISYIEPHIENLRHILDTSKEICEKYPSSKMHIDCYNVLNPLENLYINVYSSYLSLSHLTISNSTRSKRSPWFGFGGPVLKQLFGSLDEDDAKTYTDAINAVQDDQRHLATLMKENIHIVSSTVSSFNNTVQKLNNNENILNNNMAKLDKILETISQSTNKLEINTHLSMTFSALESSLMILNFKLKDLIDSILFGKQNIVHPSILSPMQLYKEFNSNSNSPIRNFPINLSMDNIHILLDISELSSFTSNNKLVFVIKIPLALLPEYHFYHVYALPTPHDINNPSSFAMINPTTKYLAITEDKLTYATLNSVSECKVIAIDYFLCKLNNIQSSVSNPICEVSILTEHITSIPNSCNYKLMYGTIDVWQKLINNRWIYVQSNIAKLSVNCNDRIVDHDIVGTGILKLPKKCIAYHKLLQFIPSNEFQSKLYIPTPNFNIINDDCCSKTKLNNSIPYLSPVKLSHINLDSLQYASHKLNQFTEELDKIENQPYHLKYGYYYGFATTVLSTALFFYIIYKIYKCVYSKGRNKSSDSCCVKIFNNCYSKPTTAIRTRTNIEMSSLDYSTESTDSSNTIPRRNLDL